MTAQTVEAFDLLPAAVASDAVRAVEDAIDQQWRWSSRGIALTGEQGPAVLRALLDLGWTPPAVTS